MSVYMHHILADEKDDEKRVEIRTKGMQYLDRMDKLHAMLVGVCLLYKPPTATHCHPLPLPTATAFLRSTFRLCCILFDLRAGLSYSNGLISVALVLAPVYTREMVYVVVYTRKCCLLSLLSLSLARSLSLSVPVYLSACLSLSLLFFWGGAFCVLCVA